MKRNYIPFIAGMSTMLLLVGLVGAANTSHPMRPRGSWICRRANPAARALLSPSKESRQT